MLQKTSITIHGHNAGLLEKDHCKKTEASDAYVKANET